ncbi:MAG: fatty acid CoA ligase family protein [Planctomycetota bacterium]
MKGTERAPRVDAPPDAPGSVNVAQYLPEQAARQPGGIALRFEALRGPRAEWSFRALDQECDRLAHGLEGIGIRRGVRTVLMVPPSPELFALTFALFKIGAVPVLVDPGMGVRSLGKCLDEAAPQAFIGIPKAHVARRLLGWAKRTVTISVTTGRLGGQPLSRVRRDTGRSFEMADTTADDIAAILFTSGSTGVPKGAVYTHGIFTAQIEMLREAYGIEPGEVDLPTFPLFALFDPALGMTAVIPKMDFTRPGHVHPPNIIGPIQEHAITNMFGSPALLDRVGRFGVKEGVKLPSLRRVLSAGAPASPANLARFQSLLEEGAEIFTPYGATEALPVASIGSRAILEETREATEQGAGICVGRPVSGVDVAIIAIDDGPIEEWSETMRLPAREVGEIVVHGPIVTQSYHSRLEADRLSKIEDLGTGRRRHRHRMGDLGYLDDAGQLWFCGRKAHRVETESGRLYTICLERIFDAHPAVRRSALVGVGKRGEQRPVLCVELEKDGSEEAVRRELLEMARMHETTREVKDILFHKGFPVDIRHNAKIFREKLAVWARGKLR